MNENKSWTLRLETYAGLLKTLLPTASGFGLFYVDGEPSWNGTADDLVELESRWSAELERLRGGRVAADGESWQLPSGDTAYLVYLKSGRDEFLGALVTVLGPTGSGQRRPYTLVRGLLDPVVLTIERELRNRRAIAALRGNVEQGFAALKLLGDVDGLMQQRGDPVAAVRRALAACVRGLELSFAALLMPERMLRLVNSTGMGGCAELQRAVATAERRLLAWVALHQGPLHLTAGEQEQAGFADLARHGHVLVSPVRDAEARVIGCLLLLRPGSRPDFEPSVCAIGGLLAQRIGAALNVDFDSVTGLIGRSGFEAQLKLHAQRLGADAAHAVLFVEVDQLSILNDCFGDHAGDEMLGQVAVLIRERLPHGSLMARLTGGRFAALLPAHRLQAAGELAEQLRQAAGWMRYSHEHRSVSLSLSIGIAEVQPQSGGQALSAAKRACRHARERGGDRIELYEDGNTSVMRRQADLDLIARLHRALEGEGLELLAQPVVSVRKPVRLWGFEVLLRLGGDDEEPVAAATLVHTAERFGLMPDIDRWVVRRLFEALAEYHDEIARLGIRFAVNLSAQSVSDGEFLSFLCKQITAAGVAGEALCFEIPETAAVSNLARARLFMERVGEYGCTFALDDFGAGASSFNYLPSLPVSFLKIDPELVAKVEQDPFAAAMVSAIREVSRSLGLETVAEAVEDGDTRARLLDLGVDRVQGYEVCHPLPLPEVLGKLAAQPNLLAS